ncbi:MAG: haloalkane dehalogenase [Haliea sp.]|uniref:haloalkane dehalogenase n=1 Tax=Haliea sp. TaxID=1932666 RepID=UPI0032EF4724
MTAILRTPDHRFAGLPDFPWQPRYLQLADPRLGPLRMHYLDEGPDSGPVILLLHGEPSWCFLYRHMIRDLTARGLRCVAPDLIGFGRSDKPAQRSDYSYAGHVAQIVELVSTLDLCDIVLVCQDWGGPIGLSALAQMPERFQAVVAANTLLPNCEAPPDGVAPWPGEIVEQWVAATRTASDLPVADIIAAVSVTPLPEAVRAAYDAPFPTAAFKAAALEFPGLIPIREDMAGVAENRRTWQLLEQWQKPFVTAFSDSDPATAAWAEVFQQRIPGARGRSHPVIRGAGHFLQEEQGPALAAVVAEVASSLA